MNARAAPVAAAVAMTITVAVTGACASIRNEAAPTCSSKRLDPLILLTQSVPTASRVPCIASYPAGWNLSRVDVRSGKATFALDSDRAGHEALRVTLERSCNVAGATEVPTDEPDTRRFERILSVDRGLRATRVYRFAGGCVSYRLQFSEKGQALVNEASIAVGFVTRSQVDARVRETTHGRRHL